jgi:hypothetical protein
MSLGPELSIQLQADSIAGVKGAFLGALNGRDPNTLWYLADGAGNIAYENRVKGISLTLIDQAVTNVSIGSILFSDWFRSHNDYFTSDRPIPNVTTLKQAIELYYRWRISANFNDIVNQTGLGGSVAASNVFPAPGTVLGTRSLTAAATGSFVKGTGPIDSTVIGPGILSAVAGSVIGGNDAVLSLTGLRADLSTVVIPVTLPSGSVLNTTVLAGSSAVTSAHTASTDLGVLHVADTSLLKDNQWVLVREVKGAVTSGYNQILSEVAEVVSLGSGVVTLRQVTPVGAVAPYAVGLRNNYTTAALMIPLFIDITGATNSNGTNGDIVRIQFYPDRPQTFLDMPLL